MGEKKVKVKLSGAWIYDDKRYGPGDIVELAESVYLALKRQFPDGFELVKE